MMNNLILLVLPMVLLFDLLIPFFIAPFYKGYQHTLQVMSVLGNNKSPLHVLYNLWLIVLGIVICTSSFILFNHVKQYSIILAFLMAFVLIIYAIGGCILAGLFSVGESKALLTMSEKLHGYGAAIGFMVLLSAPLLCGCYWMTSHHIYSAIFSMICFMFAFVFFILFIMADKPAFHSTIIALEGLWQRMTLLCMYLPVAILSLSLLKGK